MGTYGPVLDRMKNEISMHWELLIVFRIQLSITFLNCCLRNDHKDFHAKMLHKSLWQFTHILTYDESAIK